MSEISKEAVEAARDYYRMIYAKPGRAGEDTLRIAIQSAIDKATAAKDKRIADLERELKDAKEGDEANAHQCCVYEDALIGARGDDIFQTDQPERTMERIRDLIAAEGELGDARERIALMEESGLWQCGRIAEMEKILDHVPHFHTEYRPAPGGDIPSCGHPLSEPYCPRCAWEKIKGLK